MNPCAAGVMSGHGTAHPPGLRPLRAELVEEYYPKAKKIRLVQDNLNTHDGASLYEAFPPQEARRLLDKIEFHYTPKHGSWVNMAETEIGIMNRQCLNCRLDSQATWPPGRSMGKQTKCPACTHPLDLYPRCGPTETPKLYPSIED